MDDITKYALAALLILIGSHLFLWAWLKRKIAAVQREVEREKAARKEGDNGGEIEGNRRLDE